MEGLRYYDDFSVSGCYVDDDGDVRNVELCGESPDLVTFLTVYGTIDDKTFALVDVNTGDNELDKFIAEKVIESLREAKKSL